MRAYLMSNVPDNQVNGDFQRKPPSEDVSVLPEYASLKTAPAPKGNLAGFPTTIGVDGILINDNGKVYKPPQRPKGGHA